MAFKRCRTCGRKFETEREWVAQTTAKGAQPTFEGDGSELRLRICSCGNTLAVLYRGDEGVPDDESGER